MKKLAIVLLSLFVFNLFQPVFASNILQLIKKQEQKQEIKKQDSKQSIIQAIKAWKEKKRKMIKEIFQQTNISSLMDLQQAAQQLKDVSFKLKSLSTSYRALKIQKRSIDKKYQAVLQDAKNLVLNLNKKQTKLKNMLLKLQVLIKDMNSLREQIKYIKTSIEISKQQIKRYVAVLYKINNDYYSSLDSLDDIKLLVKSANIAKTLSQEDIIKILSLKTQELIGKLEKAEKIKKQFLRKLYSKKAEYVQLVNQYKTEIQVLNEKRKFLVDLLTMLKNNKKQVDALYDKLYKARKGLKVQQLTILSSIKKTLSGDKVSAKPIDLSAILQYTIKLDGDKFFNWPTRDYHQISAYFHDDNYFKKFGFEHDGIDIKVPMGTPIYAPAAGYVYKVVDNDSDYYNYIVLVHNYGYVTIYGHISKALVKQGQIVKRGQIIAFSGGQKGSRGAGKLTTGPHLHFEVRKNGQLIDPLSVLDLSVYKDKSQVPEKWQIKYIKDSLTRKIDLSNVNFFNRKYSEKKRIELFLKTRAVKAFQNLTGWVQMGEKMGIDPAVAVCIGYAESGLGRNTTTQYNVGNVGNNDRGDRRGYPNPQAGINAIYYALNNKYLSKYDTIYSLSRYGNKDAHIYSSSTFNWYKNVVKCLATIKGYPIDEYYPFRIPTKQQIQSWQKLMVNSKK